MIAVYYYQETKEFKKAFFCFKDAAENNIAKAQYSLGIMYKNGEGILKDLKKAFFWFDKAAKNNNAKAQYNLGVMYIHGGGVDIDKAKAAYWIEQAYNNGDEEAKELWEKYELWKYKK